MTDVQASIEGDRIERWVGAAKTTTEKRLVSDASRKPEPGLRRQRLALTFARERAADGLFWCSVETTRVYCRPSCPARHAKPENIRFHDTLDQARATGFRPCRRCRPDGPSIHAANLARIDVACQAIVTAGGEAPSSSTLAAASGVSRGYFYRLFKERTGLSPRAFAREVARDRP